MRDGSEGLDISRRGLLAAGAAAAPAGALAASPADPFAEAALQKTLERYHGFGNKRSGGPGDNASGAWLESELTALGYACERQGFQTPYFEPRIAQLRAGTATAGVLPQGVVVPTGPSGVTAPLHLAQPGVDLKGAIALIVLPFRRWSTAVAPDVSRPLRAAFAAGAEAAVMVTTGPTREALALNAPAKAPMFDKPVAVLAPADADPFIALAAAGAPATLTVTGQGGLRPAYNLIARRKRGGAGTLVMSTPRSGWFTCAAERGSGLAAWLALAAWAAKAPLKTDIELICTSGHEYENLGGEHYLEHRAPKPADTRLWVHVGANVAARDWHEIGGDLRPLPSPDPQRVMMASPVLIERVRRAFAGQPGLEQPYPASVEASAGELTNILKAGYAPAFGIFGAHRFHHAAGDDLRCVSAPLARRAALAFRDVIQGAVG